MLRRIFILLLMALTLAVPASAEDETPYEVFTFSASLPDALTEPLSTLIPDGLQVISGAAVQQNGSHYGDAPSFLDAYTAMVLVQTADGPRLYAAAWVEGLPWQVNDYTRFLRQQKNVYISIYQPDAYRIPAFSVDYSVQGGVKSDLFSFFANEIWGVYGHIDKGLGITVMNDHGSIERTEGVAFKNYPCNDPFYLDYMDSIDEYPITREAAEARTIAYETARAADTAGNIVYSAGAHLRKEPTGKSESLGTCAANTPMTFTGEQRTGAQWPWYQVRIGNTLGWMSSNYVELKPDWRRSPIPLGRTADGCLLYDAPGDDTPTAQLSPGVTFHILAEYDGMYHTSASRRRSPSRWT